MDHSTGGAAEAVAAMMRQAGTAYGAALLFGEQTAGTAGVRQSFPLSNGKSLEIIVRKIQLGDAQMIPTDGLEPDVAVVATDADPGLGGSRARRPSRMDEADLVRRWRGEMVSPDDPERTRRDPAPESRDPALLRALDVMEGLAIMGSPGK